MGYRMAEEDGGRRNREGRRRRGLEDGKGAEAREDREGGRREREGGRKERNGRSRVTQRK